MNIIFFGRGGQGAVTAASLMVQAADFEQIYAQSNPFFGFERRGAPVSAYLRLDNSPILERGKITVADCLVVLDPKLPEILDLSAYLVDGGSAVLNYQKNPEHLDFFEKTRLFGTVNANAIASEIFGSYSITSTNTIMLGALIATTQILDISSVIKSIEMKFANELLDKNVNAIREGYSKTQLLRGA